MLDIHNNKIGAYVDRTTEFLSLCPRHKTQISSSSNTPFLRKNNDDNFEFQNEFDDVRKIHQQLIDLDIQYKSLLSVQAKCKMPTFEEETDQQNEQIHRLRSLKSQLESIKNEISLINIQFPHRPDVESIFLNIQKGLLRRYKNFYMEFSLNQAAFESAIQKQHSQSRNSIPKPTLSLDFGGENSQILEQERKQREETAELADIAQKAAQIRQLFEDINSIIISHGEIVEVIGSNVNQTRQNAENANMELHKAQKYQKKSHMEICAIILGVLVLILLILAFLK